MCRWNWSWLSEESVRSLGCDPTTKGARARPKHRWNSSFAAPRWGSRAGVHAAHRARPSSEVDEPSARRSGDPCRTRRPPNHATRIGYPDSPPGSRRSLPASSDSSRAASIEPAVAGLAGAKPRRSVVGGSQWRDRAGFAPASPSCAPVSVFKLRRVLAERQGSTRHGARKSLRVRV